MHIHMPDPRQCPPDIVESLEAYQQEGRPTGDFLRAVIANDLMEAFGRADEHNLKALPHIVAWAYQHLRGPHGSYEAYDKHIQRHAEQRAAEEE
jgi:hypothetical protein